MCWCRLQQEDLEKDVMILRNKPPKWNEQASAGQCSCQ